MSAVEVRPLRTHGEREACVELQEETWGRGFEHRVASSMLLVATETGGVVTGAFDDDRLVGFVFGITGVRDGELIHWSDMLAVRPSHRGRGLGVRLKLHQREELLGRGVRTVYWTFDPLEARNAHVNLDRLGAVARTYRRDVYGQSASPLHAGIGTDRLVAEWRLDSERVRERISGGTGPLQPAGEATPVNGWTRAASGSGHPAPAGPISEPGGQAVTVAVPGDIQTLKADDPVLARRWRATVRSALERCFEQGYTAVATERDGPVSRYVLTRALTR